MMMRGICDHCRCCSSFLAKHDKHGLWLCDRCIKKQEHELVRTANTELLIFGFVCFAIGLAVGFLCFWEG